VEEGLRRHRFRRCFLPGNDADQSSLRVLVLPRLLHILGDERKGFMANAVKFFGAAHNYPDRFYIIHLSRFLLALFSSPFG